jgi:hypothetical protein
VNRVPRGQIFPRDFWFSPVEFNSIAAPCVLRFQPKDSGARNRVQLPRNLTLFHCDNQRLRLLTLSASV